MTEPHDDASSAPGVEGLVLSGTGGVWRVRRADGSVVEASLRGRVKKSNAGRRADGSLRRDTVASSAETLKLAVGDRVELEQDAASGAWAIAEILPRRSRLARRAPGGGQGERIVAANVDQVVVVFAAANPEPHPRMLDRFLVIAEANDLAARIVINKVELTGGVEATRARWIDYERAGYPVHYTSVKRMEGIEALHDALDAAGQHLITICAQRTVARLSSFIFHTKSSIPRKNCPVRSVCVVGGPLPFSPVAKRNRSTRRCKTL